MSQPISKTSGDHVSPWVAERIANATVPENILARRSAFSTSGHAREIADRRINQSNLNPDRESKNQE